MPRVLTRLPGSFEERCFAEAQKNEVEANTLPPGAQQDDLLRKARQAKIAASLDNWLSSPGLRPPT